MPVEALLLPAGLSQTTLEDWRGSVPGSNSAALPPPALREVLEGIVSQSPLQMGIMAERES